MARDPIGIEVPDLDSAIADVQRARAELIDEEAIDELRLEIMDEHGRIVAKVG